MAASVRLSSPTAQTASHLRERLLFATARQLAGRVKMLGERE